MEIKTIEGDKNIEDIHAGDMVYSKNTETGEEGYKEVVRVFKKKTYELVYLTVGDEEIITTPNHPFYVVDEGFVEAGNLQVGDEVETADGEILDIEAITIRYLDEPIQIYNFEVADWHTYYVSEEEVLVHNSCMRTDGNSSNPVINNMESKVSNDDIIPPDKRGNAPISKVDGKPIEIHHNEQEPMGPYREMHVSDHRYGENYKKNHPNYNKKSKVDRTEFKKWKKEYWENEWDEGRWD